MMIIIIIRSNSTSEFNQSKKKTLKNGAGEGEKEELQWIGDIIALHQRESQKRPDSGLTGWRLFSWNSAPAGRDNLFMN